MALLNLNRITSFFKRNEPSIEKKGEFVQIGQLSPSALRSFLIGGASNDDYFSSENLTFPTVAAQAFERNGTTYKCVMMIAQGVASLNYKLFNTTTNKEIEKHELLDLLKAPNPLESRHSFLVHVVADLYLDGNAFIEMVNSDLNRDTSVPMTTPPQRLWTNRPDMVQITVGSSRLPLSYIYTPGGVQTGKSKIYPVDQATGKCDLLHLTSYAPLRENSNGRGLSPVRAGWLAVLTSNESAQWNLNLIKNGATPTLILTSEDTLTAEQTADLRGQIAKGHSGSRNAGKPLLLGGGITGAKISLTPTEMGYLEGKDSVARDIATVLGVPPTLLNLPGDNTYNNVAEAKMALYEETIIPRARQIVEDFNRWLVPLFGKNLELRIDENCIPALEPKRAAKLVALDAISFYTINEKRAEVGKEPLDNGDELLVPSNMLPLAETVETDEGTEPDAEDEESGDDE